MFSFALVHIVAEKLPKVFVCLLACGAHNKSNELLIQATTRISLKIIMLSERSQNKRLHTA